MQYSRLGLDYTRKASPRVSYAKSKKRKIDWMNLVLFITLFIVIILFIFGKK